MKLIRKATKNFALPSQEGEYEIEGEEDIELLTEKIRNEKPKSWEFQSGDNIIRATPSTALALSYAKIATFNGKLCLGILSGSMENADSSIREGHCQFVWPIKDLHCIYHVGKSKVDSTTATIYSDSENGQLEIFFVH